MRKMKDSGVEWISEIPEDWEVYKFKHLGSASNGLTYSPNDMVDEENGTLVLRSSNIQNGKLCFADNVYVDINTDSSKVKKGDILICSRNGSRSLIGKNAIIESDLDAYYGAFMMVYRCDEPEYMHYIMNAGVFDYYLAQFSTSTINQLTGSALKNMLIPYCSDCTVKNRIIKYLNSKCSKIDAIIEKQQAVIEKLKEYKLSVITETVTKGLNPNVEMKDSGNEWIGKIPLNWNVTSLGALSISMRNGYVGPTRDIFYDEGIPYIQSLHVKDGTISFEKEKYFVSEEWGEKHPKVYEGQLLIVQTGDIGQVGLVSKEMNGYNCHALIIVTVNKEYIMPTFLSYYLRSHVGKELLLDTKTGALLPHLNSGKIKVTPIVYPSIEEQSEIVKFLNQKCSCINEIISKKEVILGKLHDYKKSLIYEVVTGKKEV